MTDKQLNKLLKQKAQQACKENGIKVYQKYMTLYEEGHETTFVCGLEMIEATYIMFKDEATGKEYQCFYGCEYYNPETKSLWLVQLYEDCPTESEQELLNSGIDVLYKDGTVKFKARVKEEVELEETADVEKDEENMCYRVYEKSYGLIGTFFSYFQAVCYVNDSGLSICDCEIVKEPYVVKEEPTKVETIDPMEEKLTDALQKLENSFADIFDRFKTDRDRKSAIYELEEFYTQFGDMLTNMLAFNIISSDMHDGFENEAFRLLDYYRHEVNHSELLFQQDVDEWERDFKAALSESTDVSKAKNVLLEFMLGLSSKHYDEELDLAITRRLLDIYEEYKKEFCHG